MTRYEAFIGKDWREHGLANLIVTKRRDDGSVDFGVFIVDTWCLGVKDAFGEADVPESAFRENIDEQLPEDLREPIHPSCAKKLIEGAIAYAEGLGFSPHRDFRKARRVLSGLDATLCPTSFTFGRDGRPCYVPGDDDTPERIQRVLAILEAALGPDGFDFEDPDEEDEADDDGLVRDELMDFLDAEPDEVPRFYALSGLVTAMQLSPQLIPPTKVIDALWPNGPGWESKDDAEYFMGLLVDYWNYVADLIEEVVAPDVPDDARVIDVWLEEMPEGEELAVVAASIDWAGGFVRATTLWPDAWGDALRRPDLVPHWEVVRWWADFLAPGNKERIADAAQASEPRTLAKSVRALARALRPAGPVTG